MRNLEKDFTLLKTFREDLVKYILLFAVYIRQISLKYKGGIRIILQMVMIEPQCSVKTFLVESHQLKGCVITFG